MATTTWTQAAGMVSDEDTNNLESYSEQAEASKDAAAASEAAASTSESNASASATAAASSASAASTEASEASASASSAATSATAASGSATTAAASATAASASETAAAASETAAASSETAAAASESAAGAAKDAALAALDSFDDRYLGQKTSDPALDNDGDALVAGTLYFNTTDDTMRVYDGSVWVAAYASLSGAMFGANNLSDVASASGSRTNLGLGTAATTASTDYATAAQGALADTATQPADLATVATTGAYSDLTGKPTLGTAAAADTGDFATAAQGTTADSAVQPNDSPTFGTVTATSFSGDGSALTGLPAGYTDADVDTHLNTSTATADQVLSWTGSDYDWTNAASGGGSPVVSTLNGTGTIALQNDTGVSSVTDNGTGQYQFNFADNFSTVTYYACGTSSNSSSLFWAYLSNSFSGGNQDNTRTTSQCKVGSYNSGYIDTPSVGLMASE